MPWLGILSVIIVAPAATPESTTRLTLQDVVQRALARNVTAQVARLEISRAEGLLQQARAGALPSLWGNVLYTRLDADRVVSGRVATAANELAANLTATIPLVAAKSWADWSHGRDNVAVSQAAELDLRRTVAIAATRAYLAVLTQMRLVDVSGHAVVQAKDHFDFAHSRYSAGVGNRLDELRAAQDLGSSQTALEVSATGLVRAREALGTLIAADSACDVADAFDLAPLPDQSAAETGIEERRADLLAASRRRAAAQAIANDTWLEFLPTLTATLQPFYQNPPELTIPRQGWQVMLLLSVPFYDGGTRYGHTHERNALAAEAQATLEDSLRVARSEVRVAYAAVKHAEAGWTTAKHAAESADSAVELAQKAYGAGSISNLDVVDAQKRARDADTGFVIAEDTLHQAKLDLLTAAGQFP